LRLGKTINNKQEREYLEKNVIDVRGDFKKDNLERMTAKSFELVDGKIIKYVASGRTEKGQEDAAGKMREAEISRLEKVNGAELVGLKESMEKNSKIRENLPKKGRRTEALAGEPNLPAELEGALQSLYLNYEKYYRSWEENTEARSRGLTPPVFIVVCNNTSSNTVCFS